MRESSGGAAYSGSLYSSYYASRLEKVQVRASSSFT
jgi:hypothetical protein